jgi:hypothetical protein
MGWLAVLGLISLVLVFAGCSLTVRRIRRYRRESEVRRDKAFAEMRKIGEKAVTRDS